MVWHKFTTRFVFIFIIDKRIIFNFLRKMEEDLYFCVK